MCSLGIEPTTFCTADAMLYHWATQEHFYCAVVCENCTQSFAHICQFVKTHAICLNQQEIKSDVNKELIVHNFMFWEKTLTQELSHRDWEKLQDALTQLWRS